MIPRLLDHVAATRSRELFTLTVLVLALGIAVGSALVFSVSMALGAFLAGMVVGRSEYSLRAASEALPMRDAFAVLFFVSVGMLLDPGALFTAPGLVAGALRHRARRQAAGGAAVRVGTALPVSGRVDRRHRAGPDRRVLVHPRHAWGGSSASSPARRPTSSSPRPSPRSCSTRSLTGTSVTSKAGSARARRCGRS